MPRNSLFIAILVSFALHGYSQKKSISTEPEFISAMLQQHNGFRAELQLPNLVWSPVLAKDALAWAEHLANIDKGQHDGSIRGKEGENLWWGTSDAFSYADMVGMWGKEKAVFKYGVFPDVVINRGAMVGHYTQIVWKNTTAVGCALVGNGNNDYLVCRYSAPGNVIGEKPY